MQRYFNDGAGGEREKCEQTEWNGSILPGLPSFDARRKISEKSRRPGGATVIRSDQGDNIASDQLVRAEFRVEVEEQHVLSADISRWTRSTKESVDWKEIPKDKISISGMVSDFQVPSVRFEVGEKEVHQLEAGMNASFMGDKIELFVDGRLQEQS